MANESAVRNYPQYIKPSGKIPSNDQLEKLKAEYAREHRESQASVIVDLEGRLVTRMSQLQRLGEANDYIKNSRDNWRLVAVVSMVVAFVMATLKLL
jgi:hypothetical protein